jgi:hypothetical protein
LRHAVFLVFAQEGEIEPARAFDLAVAEALAMMDTADHRGATDTGVSQDRSSRCVAVMGAVSAATGLGTVSKAR